MVWETLPPEHLFSHKGLFMHLWYIEADARVDGYADMFCCIFLSHISKSLLLRPHKVNTILRYKWMPLRVRNLRRHYLRLFPFVLETYRNLPTAINLLRASRSFVLQRKWGNEKEACVPHEQSSSRREGDEVVIAFIASIRHSPTNIHRPAARHTPRSPSRKKKGRKVRHCANFNGNTHQCIMETGHL